MIKQNKIILIIAVALIATGFILMVKENKPPQNNGAEDNAVKVNPINQSEHILGDINAPVQMIVYSDFECPFCVRFFRP